MILRWSAASVLEAERGFRRVKEYRTMSKLVTALRKHDTELERGARNKAAAAA
jgi:hypothetical protein